jgi:hypothetical protein
MLLNSCQVGPTQCVCSSILSTYCDATPSHLARRPRSGICYCCTVRARRSLAMDLAHPTAPNPPSAVTHPRQDSPERSANARQQTVHITVHLEDHVSDTELASKSESASKPESASKVAPAIRIRLHHPVWHPIRTRIRTHARIRTRNGIRIKIRIGIRIGIRIRPPIRRKGRGRRG